jgi:bacterial/archaeal transporter family-2 protein
MKMLAFAFAFLAGALVTLQIGSNARLREAMGGALPAIIVSSALGIVLLWAVILALQVPWPPLARMTAAPPSAWLGGLLGAAYAVVTVILARHVDAGTLIALVVSGQLVCSVLVDHFGVLGFDPRPLSFARAAGCGLMVGGFFLIWKF